MVIHFISVLLPSNLRFWISCEQGHTVRLYILITTSTEITVSWDLTSAVCWNNTSVLEKPAAFGLWADVLKMEVTGLSQKLVFCYQTARHHISRYFSTRTMYSPSAGQLRCAVLPAGFTTAWVMMFGFMKRGPIRCNVSLFPPAGWSFALPEVSSTS